MEVGRYKERASRGRVVKVWGDGIRILGTVARIVKCLKVNSFKMELKIEVKIYWLTNEVCIVHQSRNRVSTYSYILTTIGIKASQVRRSSSQPCGWDLVSPLKKYDRLRNCELRVLP